MARENPFSAWFEDTPPPTTPPEEERENPFSAWFDDDQSITPITEMPEETLPSGDPRDEGFFPILGRTIDELQASGWAGLRVLGEATGSERLIEVGDEGVRFNERQVAKYGRPMQVEDFEDIGDLVPFIKQGIAQILPSIAISMPTAIAGGRAGATAGTFVGGVPGAAVGAVLGGALGAFLPSFILSTGEVDREMKARAGEDFEDPGAAFTGGALVGALDVASVAFGLKPLMPVILKKASIKDITDKLISEGVEKSVAQAAVSQALAASLIEGSTEASQEYIEDAMAESATGIASEEGQLQSALLNAFSLGAIGGVSMGGVSGYISQGKTNKLLQNEKEIATQLETMEQEVQDQVNLEGKTWKDMKLRELKEEGKARGLDLEKVRTKKEAIEKLTNDAITEKKKDLMYAYLVEEFGNLSPQEIVERQKLRAELEAIAERGPEGINELILIAEGSTLEKKGEKDIPTIDTNRKQSVGSLINRILDRHAIDRRAEEGNSTSLLFRAALTKEYQDRKKLLLKEKRPALVQMLKARGLRASTEVFDKKGKVIGKKVATNEQIVQMLLDHDVFLFRHKQRMENYYEGKGYNRTKLLPFTKGRYRKKIEKEGPSQKYNIVTVREGDVERTTWGIDETWEQFVDRETGEAGTAVEITYEVDGKPLHEVMPEGSSNIRKDDLDFEQRNVVADEEGVLTGGSGLFDSYEKAKRDKRKKVVVKEVRLEHNPDLTPQGDPIGGIIGALRHWFAPSGPLGWSGFMAKRQRIANIRKMNQFINQAAKRTEMALSHSVSHGEYANEEMAQEALRRALNATTLRFKRTTKNIKDADGNVVEEAETAEVERELAERRERVKAIEKTLATFEALSGEDIAAYEGPSRETWIQLNKEEQKLLITRHILKGDILELEQILDPKAVKLNPAQAANRLLSPSLREPFLEIRSFIDMMSERLLRELPQELLQTKRKGAALEEVIKENLGNYMTRSYKIFEAGGFYDPTSWWQRNLPTKSAKEIRKNIAAVEEMLVERGSSREAAKQETRRIAAGMAHQQPIESFTGLRVLGRDDPASTGEIGFESLTKDVLLIRQRIPKPIRALMGEVTNPLEAAAVTTARLSALLENNRFWQTLAVLNEEAGQRLFSPVPLTGEQLGKAPGWLGKDKGFYYQVNTEGYNPFNGMYTTRGVAEALGQMGAAQEMITSGMNASIWKNLVLTPKAWTQLGKIVLSPPAQIRNFISATMFVMGNGHILGIARNFPKAMKIISHELWEGGIDSQGRPISARQNAQRTYRRLQELGVLNTSVRLGDVLNTFRLANSGMFQEAGDFTAILWSPLRDKYKRAEQFYTAADDFWKIIAYYSELQNFEKIFKTEADYKEMLDWSRELGMQETLNKNDFIAAREELAAFYVRQTVPNYDYVGGFADILRSGVGAPFGNFIAFPTELVRTSANINALAFKEMGSNNWQIQKRGAARMAGYGVSAFGIGAAAQAIGQAMHDIDDEDLEASRFFLADWAKNNLLIPIEKKDEAEGGGFDYIDGSYVLVYDDLARVPFATLREYEEGREEGRGIGESASIAMAKTITEFMEPYMEPSIFHQAALDVLQNRNSNTGKPIFNPAKREALPFNGAAEEATTYLKYLWDRTQPGITAAGGKILRGQRAEEQAYDNFGNKQELNDAWKSFFGIKVNRVNPTSSLNFALSDLLNQKRDAKKIFSRVAYNRGAVTPQELESAWLESQKATYFINQTIHNTFKAAEQLNANTEELDTVKKDRFVSKKERRDLIEEGLNVAIKPSKTLKKQFETRTEQLERDEGIRSIRFWDDNAMEIIYDYFNGLPLGPELDPASVREEE